jgi:hypothetical protein
MSSGAAQSKGLAMPGLHTPAWPLRVWGAVLGALQL